MKNPADNTTDAFYAFVLGWQGKQHDKHKKAAPHSWETDLYT